MQQNELHKAQLRSSEEVLAQSIDRHFHSHGHIEALLAARRAKGSRLSRSHQDEGADMLKSPLLWYGETLSGRCTL